MGIVSYCPNGHRVKVKDFQAGRRGLCPTCGAKFRIPAASTGAGSPETGRAASPVAGGPPPETDLPLARFVPLDPAAVATLPRALPFGSSRAASPPLHPAIADRPDLSWRIAYPGGEPSEPVDAVTMQDWLTGGQAEGTELVWRADWADWLPVRDVFAEFFPGA